MRDEPDLPSRQRRKSSTAAAGLHRRRHRDPPIPGQTILSARFPPESGRPIRRTLRLQRSRREICRACRRVSAGRQIDGKHYRLWAVGNRPSFEHRRFLLGASRLWACGVGPIADRRADSRSRSLVCDMRNIICAAPTWASLHINKSIVPQCLAYVCQRQLMLLGNSRGRRAVAREQALS